MVVLQNFLFKVRQVKKKFIPEFFFFIFKHIKLLQLNYSYIPKFKKKKKIITTKINKIKYFKKIKYHRKWGAKIPNLHLNKILKVLQVRIYNTKLTLNSVPN